MNNNFEDLTKKDWYSSKSKVSNLVAEFKLYIYVAKIDSDNFWYILSVLLCAMHLNLL